MVTLCRWAVCSHPVEGTRFIHLFYVLLTVHSGMILVSNQIGAQFFSYEVHTPKNALFIKLDKVLKFTLKIILNYSYLFRSTTFIREPSLEPS